MAQQAGPTIARWTPSQVAEGLRKPKVLSPGLSLMSSEGRLLVLCARTAVSEFVRVEIADLVCHGMNWDVVWELSKTHGVAPLVYRNLAMICPAAMPSMIHEAYRRHNQANALLNTLLSKELVTLLDALAAKGITAIPFKGVTLAQVAYGDLSLRECADIDLIVEQEAIPQARKILWSQGYQLTSQDEGADDESAEPYHFFQKRNGIVAVDLQWVMARRHFGFRLDRSVFWSRLKPINLPTKSVQGLCPEDLLILLCVHGSKHAWEQLKWICDVAELVRRRPTLDWSRVLFQSNEWHCRRMVLLGLAMAQSLFDTVLPRTVLHEIQADVDIPVLVRRMPKQLLKNPSHGIDEDCADALYVTIKDFSWEQWKLGVTLCRAEADVITRPLPWFRFQRKLRMLAACLRPLHRVIAKGILSVRMRGRIVRWLQSS
ncbi:MAG: hypothetical protein GDA65_19200 [Nitrospira sp. CR1.1]|nr:hypothetical protein [Nitrospira sp. CR1.1]